MKPRINAGRHFTVLVIALFCLTTLSHALPEWQIEQQALNGTVFVKTKDISQTNIGHASGFFVAPYRIVVPYHVIVGANSAEWRNAADEPWFDIEGVTAMDPDQNLAVLAVSIPGNPLPLGTSDDVGPDQDIYVSSHSSGRKSFTKGKVGKGKVGKLCGKLEFSLEVKVEPGSDGAPVLNVDGKVVGIFLRGMVKAEGTLPLLAFAIPSDSLPSLLNSNKWGETIQPFPLQANLNLCALISRGNMKFEKGNYDAAYADYSRVISRNRDAAIAYSNRGYARLALGDTQGAKADFRLAKGAAKRINWSKLGRVLGKIIKILFG